MDWDIWQTVWGIFGWIVALALFITILLSEDKPTYVVVYDRYDENEDEHEEYYGYFGTLQEARMMYRSLVGKDKSYRSARICKVVEDISHD